MRRIAFASSLVLLLTLAAAAQTSPRAVTFSTPVRGADPASDGSAVAVAVGSDGTYYVASEANATDFGLKPVVSNEYDVVVRALNSDGSEKFATVVRAQFSYSSTGFAVDSAGNSYVGGTDNNNTLVATAGALNNTGQGFVAKISPSGAILWVARTGADRVTAVKVDANGVVYATGTASSTMPVTPGAFQPNYPNTTVNGGTSYGRVAFVQKISADGGSLLYSSFFGANLGPNQYYATGTVPLDIAIDPNGAVYLTGQSDALPTVNAVQWQPVGAAPIFVAKFQPDLGSLVYSTYLGNSGSNSYYTDVGGKIVADAAGNAYILGTTDADDYVFTGGFTTPIGFTSVSQGNVVFVAKLDPTGQKLLYSNAVALNSHPGGLALNSDGSVYVAGTLGSGLFSPTSDAIDFRDANVVNGGIGKLDASGNVVWWTPFPSAATAAALDPAGNLVIAGLTPAGVEAPQVNTTVATQLTNGSVPFVTKIALSSSPSLSISPTLVPTVMLRNLSTNTLQISSISVSPELKRIGGDCGTQLAPGDVCGLVVSPTATSNNVTYGQITVNSNASPASQTATITIPARYGPITSTSAALRFEHNLALWPQAVGTTAPTQTVHIVNGGASPSQITQITSSADVQQSHNCTSPLPVGAGCTLNLSWTPSGQTSSSFSWTITHDNYTDTAYAYAGVSSTPLVFSANALTFAQQYVGMPALAHTFSIANVSNGTQTVVSIALPANFSQQNNCSSIPPHTACRVSVLYTPTTNESVFDNVTVTYSGGSQKIQVSATGRIFTNLDVSTYSMDFGYYGNQIYTSVTQPLTLTNTGSNDIGIKGFRYPSAYSVDNGCPTVLVSHANCTVNVTFTPTAITNYDGVLYIDHTGTNSPQQVQMHGNGVYPVRMSAVNDFGSVQVGTTSAPQYVAISNSVQFQGRPMNITSVTTTGDFKVQDDCPLMYPAFISCGAAITFAPTQPGKRTGSLIITKADSPYPSILPLSGTGTLAPGQVAAGVSIITPGDGSIVGTPVHVAATATAPLPIVAMQIFVDGVSQFSTTLAALDTQVALSGGSHTLLVQARDNAGNVYKNSETLTVLPTIVPQTGWYWNPVEPGRGYFIERQNNDIFMAAFMYGGDGRPVWYLATHQMGPNSYLGTFDTYMGGQTLTGPFQPNHYAAGSYGVTLQLYDSSPIIRMNLGWSNPGSFIETIDLHRFGFSSDPGVVPPQPGAPETGWWWNPAESGRGFAIEFQGNSVFLVGFMYDTDGMPLWYLSSGPMTTPTSYSGSWTEYGGGQTMTGIWQPNKVLANAGPLRLNFSDSRNGTMTLPDGRQIPITRFQF